MQTFSDKLEEHENLIDSRNSVIDSLEKQVSLIKEEL